MDAGRCVCECRVGVAGTVRVHFAGGFDKVRVVFERDVQAPEGGVATRAGGEAEHADEAEWIACEVQVHEMLCVGQALGEHQGALGGELGVGEDDALESRMHGQSDAQSEYAIQGGSAAGIAAQVQGLEGRVVAQGVGDAGEAVRRDVIVGERAHAQRAIPAQGRREDGCVCVVQGVASEVEGEQVPARGYVGERVLESLGAGDDGLAPLVAAGWRVGRVVAVEQRGDDVKLAFVAVQVVGGRDGHDADALDVFDGGAGVFVPVHEHA